MNDNYFEGTGLDKNSTRWKVKDEIIYWNFSPLSSGNDTQTMKCEDIKGKFETKFYFEFEYSTMLFVMYDSGERYHFDLSSIDKGLIFLNSYDRGPSIILEKVPPAATGI